MLQLNLHGRGDKQYLHEKYNGTVEVFEEFQTHVVKLVCLMEDDLGTNMDGFQIARNTWLTSAEGECQRIDMIENMKLTMNRYRYLQKKLSDSPEEQSFADAENGLPSWLMKTKDRIDVYINLLAQMMHRQSDYDYKHDNASVMKNKEERFSKQAWSSRTQWSSRTNVFDLPASE